MIFLKTERLILRNVQPKDLEILYGYRNQEACIRFQRGQVRGREELRELIQKRSRDRISLEKSCFLCVALQKTDRMAGEILLMPSEETFSLGYTFASEQQGRGYACEALSALLTELHNRWPEWDSICFTEPGNLPSRRLLEKLGYEDLGYLPSRTSQVYGKWLRSDTRAEIEKAVR